MSFPFLIHDNKQGRIAWLIVAIGTVGLIILGVITFLSKPDFEEHPSGLDRLQLELEECQLKLSDTEDFNELSLIECEREIEYWKGVCLLRVEGCEGVLQTMQEVNTNIGCDEKLTTFKHGFYYERAQRKKAERQLEPPEEHGAAQPD